MIPKVGNRDEDEVFSVPKRRLKQGCFGCSWGQKEGVEDIPD